MNKDNPVLLIAILALFALVAILGLFAVAGVIFMGAPDKESGAEIRTDCSNGEVSYE